MSYFEPDDFFPKELRKKYGLGEYSKEEEQEEKDRKKTNEEIRKFVNDDNKK